MRSERRSLLRLRGEGGEGLRRRRGGLRLLSLRRESRCLNDIGLLARLCGDDLLGLDLCPHDTTMLTQSHSQDLPVMAYAIHTHGRPLHSKFDAKKVIQHQSQGCTFTIGHRATTLWKLPLVAMCAPGHDNDMLEPRHMQRHAG